jgi:hypothetical protein
MSAEIDVRTFLCSGASIAGVSTGNCFVGPVRKAGGYVPGKSVFVKEYGGMEPSPYMDATRKTYRSFDVQVMVRGDVNQYVGTRALADSVWHKMDRASAATVSTASTTYVRIVCAQSAPIYVGQDDQERDLFSVNVRLEAITSV